MAEVTAAGLPVWTGSSSPVEENELSALPEPVARYMRFMKVVGRPRDWSLRAHLVGHFRPSPKHPWMPLEAWQYNSALDIARIFHMRIALYGVLPVLARDVYLHGRGRMNGKALDLATVFDEQGSALDVGELVTYLNDAILLAPSMLLGPQVTWEASGAHAFEVTLRDRSLAVTAHVSLDERGAPLVFTTTDRFVQDPYSAGHPFVRARWSTPIDGWREVDGRPLPTSGTAIWNLPQGDFAYAQIHFEAGRVEFNVAPDRELDEHRRSA